MQITGKMKMADVIHHNYILLPVIDRFGISLGFGDATVEEICKKKSINMAFFLDIVNAYHDVNYFPETDLLSFSVNDIIEYLRKAHTHYLQKSVPKIETLINQLISDSSIQKKQIELLKNFFIEYKNEITTHIQREETVVYPYAVEIAKAYDKNLLTEKLKLQMTEYSMLDYVNEHDNIEEKIYDLKNIIIKYLPPPENIDLCHEIIIQLFNLENDLNDHSRIEEKVLVPKITQMERSLKNKFKPNQ